MKKRVKLLASCSALAVVLAIAGVAVMSATNINVSIENTINYVATGNVKATVKIAEYGVGDNTTMSAPVGEELPDVEGLFVKIGGTEQNNAPEGESEKTYHKAGNINIGEVVLSAADGTKPIVYFYTVQVTNNAPQTDTNKYLVVEFTSPEEQVYESSTYGLTVVYDGTASIPDATTTLRPAETVTMTVTFTGNPNTTYTTEEIGSSISLEVTNVEPPIVEYDLAYVSSVTGNGLVFNGGDYDNKFVEPMNKHFAIYDLVGLYNFAAIVNGARSNVPNNTSDFSPEIANSMEGSTVVLKNDIDISGTGWAPNYVGGTLTNAPSQSNWVPIGEMWYNFVFLGNFDGDGHEISGLYIKQGYDSQGFFGYTRSGLIQNLGLVNSYIYGGEYVGGIVGYGPSTNYKLL